ncbi:hypothetical protein [Chroococcidiopsis sp.]|uniref:hypothetical protein n=1 Tax=Chroococcidiopsis sp. TaxID=3088168 RepID=UPI003F2F77EF
MTLTHVSEIVSPQEQAKILSACPAAHTLEGISVEDIEAILQWAETTRLANLCLDMAIAGQLNIILINGEPCFSTAEDVKAA